VPTIRDYLPKSYNLPRWAYRIVIETIRGYDDMVRAMKDVEYDEIFSGAGPVVMMSKNRGVSRPTESKTIRIIKRNKEFEQKTKAIEQALIYFEQCDRDVILNNIKYQAPLRYPWETERNSTLGRRKRILVLMVAENLGLV